MTNKLEVILAGYNVDEDTLKNPDLPQTPETISAAYARISRAEESVTELREQSLNDVSEARASNKRIVYGFGHGSVAEHAVFNFDILNISRLALEALEHFRLASFTEKSQRYVKGADYMIPHELTSEHSERMIQLNEEAHVFYNRALQEGVGAEDARFVFPLSTVGQVGFTSNARELEHIIKCLRHHKLAEVRDLSEQLYSSANKIAPSLFKLYDQDFFESFPMRAQKSLQRAIENTPQGKKSSVSLLKENDVVLAYDTNPEINILANLLFSYTRSDLEQSFVMAESILNPDQEGQAKIIYKEILQDMNPHDRAPREFETGPFNFQFVASSSFFAQLKRHRMATLLQKPYDFRLGYTTPEGIYVAGLTNEYNKFIQKAEELSIELKKEYGPEVSVYSATNAHRRLCSFICNARELYAFSRLREDKHAQWEIRYAAHTALKLAQKACPSPLILTGGKIDFDAIRESIYKNE